VFCAQVHAIKLRPPADSARGIVQRSMASAFKKDARRDTELSSDALKQSHDSTTSQTFVGAKFVKDTPKMIKAVPQVRRLRQQTWAACVLPVHGWRLRCNAWWWGSVFLGQWQ
jgi:hypothetical protein